MTCTAASVTLRGVAEGQSGVGGATGNAGVASQNNSESCDYQFAYELQNLFAFILLDREATSDVSHTDFHPLNG